MSQAGITRADKVAYLELHGWEKQPRKLGAANRWLDPVTDLNYPTEDAYELCKNREEHDASQKRSR